MGDQGTLTAEARYVREVAPRQGINVCGVPRAADCQVCGAVGVVDCSTLAHSKLAADTLETIRRHAPPPEVADEVYAERRRALLEAQKWFCGRSLASGPSQAVVSIWTSLSDGGRLTLMQLCCAYCGTTKLPCGCADRCR